MTPIERTRERAAALQALGVGAHAGPDEIRDAWRRIAFERHPDHCGEGHESFARAKAAYDLLKKDHRYSKSPPGELLRSRGRTKATPTVPAARPSVASRISLFGSEDLAECHALLQRQTDLGTAIGACDVQDLSDGAAKGEAMATTDHVPQSVLRAGRRLTFLVDARLERGANRIALPTALLEDSRKLRPIILTVLSSRAGEAEVSIPDDLAARMFPGARTVGIRFSTDSEGGSAA